ncbi:MAG TPA: DUF305 domain-containing protein [Actinomycetes bacterium]|nr:DUF305 domain-containing protein [Actinomycetes bacterium]
MKYLTAVVAAGAALVLGLVLGALLLGGEATPSDTSAEAGFARDMSVHHEQAVELAFIIRDRSDDPEIRALAYDIINTQRAQIGMFSGWLQQWDLPQTSTAPPMAWVDHGHMSAMSDMPMDSYDDMPGMASDEQLDELREAKGIQAERMFLELMIDHHKGGVQMAEAVEPLTDRDEVEYLASTIVQGQQAEIFAMEQMLADRS